ncbi:glycosyltransferase [Clostridium perfringens]|uniref:glycosyltransferase n=3 Tax=Clostridium perfringens TaxID=1502 RepID=UPI001C862B01|nr:glycosyltransferase family 2 protein [Clostridium perfringens]MDK0937058.1 glycosyltransferase family 2 protein [Clostridium perfringens]
MVKENLKVSVIVPVYNVETYLERCLESLINQTLREIEIICVNDGSTDNSLEILNKYANFDSRIKVINKENEGLSSARNKGLEFVKGDFISFVDSDDWIDLNMLKDMYEKSIKENCTLAICSYSREYSTKSRIKEFSIENEAIYYKEDVHFKLHRKLVGPIKEELAKPDHIDSLVMACAKLYKTSIIKENNIRFIDTSIIGTEDCIFNIYVFKYVDKAIFINKPYYFYWKENSNSLTSVHKDNLKEKWFNMYRYIKDFLDENNYEEIFYHALNNRICMSTLGLGLNECNKANNVNELQKIKNLKEILNDKEIINAFKTLELTYLPIHWKLFYIFNKNKLAILSYLMLNSIEFLRTRI